MLETLLERYHSEKHPLRAGACGIAYRDLSYLHRKPNIHRVLKELEACLPPELNSDTGYAALTASDSFPNLTSSPALMVCGAWGCIFFLLT
jgi:hypothetical protein